MGEWKSRDTGGGDPTPLPPAISVTDRLSRYPRLEVCPLPLCPFALGPRLLVNRASWPAVCRGARPPDRQLNSHPIPFPFHHAPLLPPLFSPHPFPRLLSAYSFAGLWAAQVTGGFAAAAHSDARIGHSPSLSPHLLARLPSTHPFSLPFIPLLPGHRRFRDDDAWRRMPP